MNKTNIKNLIRKTYNDLASEHNDPVEKYGLHGVSVQLARLQFLSQPSPETAVGVVVEQLRAELAMLQERDIPQEKWPRFFQDKHWIENTYQRYGLPYPERVIGISPIQTVSVPRVENREEPPRITRESKTPSRIDRPGESDTFGDCL